MPVTEHKCELAECESLTTRPHFCSEPHARRNRQRRNEPSQEQRQEEDLRAALRRAQTATARAKAKSEDLVQAVYTAARDAALAQGLPAPVPVVKTTKVHGNEVALIHTTDWQYGKLTETYSMAKCEERLDIFANKIGLLTSIQRTAHPVNKAVVMFGGDIVENINIFPGQAFEVEANLFEQMFGAVRIGTEFIRRMLGIFPEVEVVAEEGNHGRLMKRGDFPHTDNVDMMVYEIIRQKFETEKRVTWQPRRSFYQPVAIGEYRAILIHGDEIKSFGGNTPAFGLLRKGTAWSSGVIPESFSDIYFGHFHTPMALTLPNGGTMYGAGSTESDNVYAQEFVAARGKPSQRLHYIDPRKGRVTCQYQVYLDESN